MLNAGLGEYPGSTALLLGFGRICKKTVFTSDAINYRNELVERGVNSSALSFNVGFSF
jgi:hypothetical protein